LIYIPTPTRNFETEQIVNKELTTEIVPVSTALHISHQYFGYSRLKIVENSGKKTVGEFGKHTKRINQ